jgi:hypothetical protein
MSFQQGHTALSSTTDFVAELIRAANQIESLTALEKNRLLDRAATVVREMREQMGIPTTRTGGDAVVEIQVVVEQIDCTDRADRRVPAGWRMILSNMSCKTTCS